MRRNALAGLLAGVALSLATAIATPAAEANSPDDILVIANNSVGVSSLSVEDVRAIFLKKRTSWQSGGKAIPVHAKDGTSLRQAFLERVLGMTSGEETSYWQDQKIRKGIDGPTEFSNPLKAVFRIQGGISYVFRSDYKEGVAKVLLVLPR